ncbi:uncharacterized protein PV06_01147 [Exophiala oligosperma]|uniref:GH16 domain-containing protein n=1 Tax=Exophiala oligosperma TaxID=215243 RepID=A0A0D2E1D6_9EURO|nr:uncharacterized protein PV06_01147 [Exophiala oligosperma]KIW48575.1 hypothetical protein PV06_01147 [Exophiala oligosperma]
MPFSRGRNKETIVEPLLEESDGNKSSEEPALAALQLSRTSSRTNPPPASNPNGILITETVLEESESPPAVELNPSTGTSRNTEETDTKATLLPLTHYNTVNVAELLSKKRSHDSSDLPSPGTPLSPPLSRTITRIQTQGSQRPGSPRPESGVDRNGYFSWRDGPGAPGATSLSTPAGSRKSSTRSGAGKDIKDTGSRRASAWERSKSLAENYFKPDIAGERPRRHGYSKPHPELDLASLNNATASGSEWFPSNGNSAFDFGRRRSSAGVNGLELSTSNDSSIASRNGSVSGPPGKSSVLREKTRRTSISKQGRQEKRHSLSEYIKPKFDSERRTSQPSRPFADNLNLSRSASVSHVSDEWPADSPQSAGVSKVPWTFNRLWSDGVTRGIPSQNPPRSLHSRHQSMSEKSQGKPGQHRPSVAVFEKAVPKPGVYFRSRRVKDNEIDRSWLQGKKDPRQRWLNIFPLLGVIVGLIIAGVYIFLGVQSVPKHKYCMVYEDDFSAGILDTNIWTKDVEVGGFGNGQFEETTGTDENVFIKDGILHIQPTLQDVDLLTHNSVLNLTRLGTCTSDLWSNCVAVTNTTNGTIINPVKSGRITTKKGANIKYGRIEVVAKMPQGDWLWPAIWMLPTDSVYGVWPQSGEIDVAESRGNNHTYPEGGNNIIGSTLHWGPNAANDAWWRTFGKQHALHSTFSERYHTFGLEWSEKYLYTYLDSRLLQVLYNRFNTPFWKRGDFPLSLPNGTAIVNPWSQATDKAAPFDEDFFLILNVAVGGTNGWFKDGVAGKPWVDTSPLAMGEFWSAKDSWYPTWQNEHGSALQVKSVKMWQQQGYNGCNDQAQSIG